MQSFLYQNLIFSDCNNLYSGNYHGESSSHSTDRPQNQEHSLSSATTQWAQSNLPSKSRLRQLLITDYLWVFASSRVKPLHLSAAYFLLGTKITVDGDCSHEIKRHLLLGRKSMTNLDSILKSRDISLLTKVHIIKAMAFLVIMYGCESWTIKKAERQRIDAFELWCWIRLLRVPWTSRRSNQSILKKISLEYSLEELMLKLKLQCFGHQMEELTYWKRPWCWERLKAGGEGDDRGWDGWMASPARWTWVWANPGS